MPSPKDTGTSASPSDVTPKAPLSTIHTSTSGYFSQPGSSQIGAVASPAPIGENEPLSPDATDRVFPIRSVVGVDLAKQASVRSESPLSSERSFGAIAPPDPAIILSSDAGSVRSARDSIASVLSAGTPGGPTGGAPEEVFVTQRFAYQQTDDGHMVVTGISGAEKMQRCEDEPIHCPGAIQGFGALLVLKQNPDEDSKLTVRVASEVGPSSEYQISVTCVLLS